MDAKKKNNFNQILGKNYRIPEKFTTFSKNFAIFTKIPRLFLKISRLFQKSPDVFYDFSTL